MCNIPKLDLANINAYTKFGKIQAFCSQVIVSGNKIINEIVTSIKGHNSIANP